MRLTTNEIILIIVIIAIAVGGFGAKHFREAHPAAPAVKPKASLPPWKKPRTGVQVE